MNQSPVNENDPVSSYYDQIWQVYETRKNVLLGSAPTTIKTWLLENSFFAKFEERLSLLKPATMNHLEIEFYLNLIVAGTRVWEAFARDENGQPRFKDWINEEAKVLRMITGDAKRISVALRNGVIITDFNKKDCLAQASNNLCQNIKVVQLVTQDEVSTEDIQKYFQQTTFLYFEDKPETFGWLIQDFLRGLSSVDGKITYLNKSMDKDPSQAMYRVIEHEAMHNLPRLEKKNQDMYLISAEKNFNLRTGSGQMIEAGDFYEMKCYKKYVPLPSPFCLNQIDQRRVL